MHFLKVFGSSPDNGSDWSLPRGNTAERGSPRSLQSELRRCISIGKQQGYNMLNNTNAEDNYSVGVSALGFQEP